MQFTHNMRPDALGAPRIRYVVVVPIVPTVGIWVFQVYENLGKRCSEMYTFIKGDF